MQTALLAIYSCEYVIEAQLPVSRWVWIADFGQKFQLGSYDAVANNAFSIFVPYDVVFPRHFIGNIPNKMCGITRLGGGNFIKEFRNRKKTI